MRERKIRGYLEGRWRKREDKHDGYGNGFSWQRGAHLTVQLFGILHLAEFSLFPPGFGSLIAFDLTILWSFQCSRISRHAFCLKRFYYYDWFQLLYFCFVFSPFFMLNIIFLILFLNVEPSISNSKKASLVIFHKSSSHRSTKSWPMTRTRKLSS